MYIYMYMYIRTCIRIYNMQMLNDLYKKSQSCIQCPGSPQNLKSRVAFDKKNPKTCGYVTFFTPHKKKCTVDHQDTYCIGNFRGVHPTKISCYTDFQFSQILRIGWFLQPWAWSQAARRRAALELRSIEGTKIKTANIYSEGLRGRFPQKFTPSKYHAIWYVCTYICRPIGRTLHVTIT